MYFDLRSKGYNYLNCPGKVNVLNVWFCVWELVPILPQSCGDDICFDTGFQGIKCDTAQHLEENEEDMEWAFSVQRLQLLFSL